MESEEADQVFTSADRIRQLNEIDKDVAKLLHSAGLAIRALTNSAPEETSSSEGALEAHKRAFKEASAQYFALLSSIDVRLRRQVYALEEADIILPETSEGSSGPSATTLNSAGGANPLEISWLNSRKDTVGKDKEAELWADARKLVTEHMAAQQDDSGNSDGNTATTGETMQVD